MANDLIERDNVEGEELDLFGSKIKLDGNEISKEQLSSTLHKKIDDINTIAFDKYLIIGTCVRLENSDTIIMIIGYNYTQNGQSYDYIGCIYPNGVNNSQPIIFNHEQIERIYYVGYTTQLGNDYKSNLDQRESTNSL